MALMTGLGRLSTSQLRRIAVEAVQAVAEHANDCGLGRAARFHGSSVTHGYTFVEWGDTPIFAGDVDMLVFANLSPTDCRELQRALTSTFASALGSHRSHNSRVSAKIVDAEFRRAPEAKSLRESALLGGCSSVQMTRMSSHLALKPSAVRFPFALPYGIWRALPLLNGNMSERTIALYEITKGLTRASSDGGAMCDIARIVGLEELRSNLLSRQFELRRSVPRTTGDTIVQWLRYEDPLTSQICGRTVAACQAELKHAVLRKWPTSLLARRMSSLAAEAAA